MSIPFAAQPGPWVKLSDYRFNQRARLISVSRKIIHRQALPIPGLRPQDAEIDAEVYEQVISSAISLPGVSVVAMYWDLRRDMLAILATHGSFARSNDGEMIPEYWLVHDRGHYALAKEWSFTNETVPQYAADGSHVDGGL